MIHLHIERMALETIPHLEVFNGNRLRELGYKYNAKIERLKDQLLGVTDPAVIREIEDQIRKIDEAETKIDDEQVKKIADQFKTFEGKQLEGFERNLGLRVKKLCGEDSNEPPKVNLMRQGLENDDYINDAEHFYSSIKSNFLQFRTEFREVMDRVRKSEYDTFAKLGSERAKSAPKDA